jgi:two-component system, OmpR family, response regulator
MATTRAARVLVAEDDLAIQRLLAATLRRRKVDVQVARDGAEAQRMLKDGAWDVLLMDLMMPKVDGWNLISWLGAHPRHRPKSVIVMTAAERNILRTLDPSVVNAIFFKPFDVNQLSAYIRGAALHDGKERRRARLVAPR